MKAFKFLILQLLAHSVVHGGHLVVTLKLEPPGPVAEGDPFSGEDIGKMKKDWRELEIAESNKRCISLEDGRELSYFGVSGARMPELLLKSRILLASHWKLELGEFEKRLNESMLVSELVLGQKTESDVYHGAEDSLTLSPAGFLIYASDSVQIALEFLMADDGEIVLRCRKVFAFVTIADEKNPSDFYMLQTLGRRLYLGNGKSLTGQEYVLLKGEVPRKLWTLFLEAQSKRTAELRQSIPLFQK